jgi:uncharacterized membrane protein YjjP (DUF1212 family)
MSEQKTNREVAQIMDFSLALGEEILVRGGELWRVEAVLNDIFKVYGLQNTSIFMLPHTLIISTRKEGEETIIRQRTIGNIVVNMEELSRLNTLIREVLDTEPAPEKLSWMLAEAIRGKSYSEPMTVLGMVIALLSLNYIIGGGVIDAVFIAIGIILVMGADMYLSHIPGTQKMFVCAVGTFVVGMIDMAAYRMGIVTDPYHIMVVTAIGLVPGIPLINSCREVFCGRVLGGSLLFMTAFMETLAVVCGFGIAISVMGV